MISRRRVLIGSGALAAATATQPTLARAEGPQDRARVLANVTAYFAGTSVTNSNPVLAGKLDRIDDTARRRLDAMDAAGSDELFAGLDDLRSNDPNLARSFSHLYDIALATVTPHPDDQPSELEGDLATQDRVLTGLQWLYDNHFADQSAGYFGNWYHWEIGIPRSVSMTLALLYERVQATRPEMIMDYIEAMDGYLRHGENGDVDLDSRFHTGANLADITTSRIVQGAISADDARITKAISDQLTVYATIDPYDLQHGVRDGHYADGSFVQHESVAYTGSYGLTLLRRVTQTIALLDGTDFLQDQGLTETINDWISRGFAPVIFEGWMMEIVKGRAVSRTTTGYAGITAVVEAAVALADQLAPDPAATQRRYVKYLATSSQTPPDPSDLTSPANIGGYHQILTDAGIEPADIVPASSTFAFNAMERNVHRRPGFAFALARCSDRISKYEYMNGENLLPWFQGDGAHYLYLAGLDQTDAFGIDYYTSVAPYRLAGVTAPVEDRQSIPELYGSYWYENPGHPLEFTSSSESQNTYVYFPRATGSWSGGATLGPYAMAGMIKTDDVAYRDKQAGILPDDFVAYANADSTTSWLMLDEEIVVLTAGITDAHGRDVTTTLDTRIAGPDERTEITGELRGGRPWSGNTRAPLSWLRYANTDVGAAIGYLLLEPSAVQVQQQRVSNSMQVVRVSNPDTVVDKQVFGLTVTHRAEDPEPGSVAYALVPQASEETLRAYQRPGRPRIEVLANSAALQAVRHNELAITAVNAFTDQRQRVAGVTVNGPVSALLREAGDSVEVAISDPVFDQRQVTISLDEPLQWLDGDAEVSVTGSGSGTRITVDTWQSYGATFSATLRRR